MINQRPHIVVFTLIVLLLAGFAEISCGTSGNKDYYNPYIGEDPETLVALLESEDALTRIAASDALVLLGEQALPAVMDDWVNGTYHSELIIREIGSEAVPLLIEQIQTTDDPEQKGFAFHFLTCIGPEAYSAVSVVASDLDNPDEGFNSYVCNALSRIGLPSEAATQSLLDALSEPLPQSSLQTPGQLVAEMITTLGTVAQPGNEDVINALLPFMEPEADPYYKPAAAYTLFKMGWHSQEMFDFLVDIATGESTLSLTRDVEKRVLRSRAVDRLASIGDEQSIWILSEVYDQSDRPDHFGIIMALYETGPNPESVPLLSKALCSSEYSTQFMAILGLMHLGPQAQEALPDMRALHDNAPFSQLHESNAPILEEAIIRISRAVEEQEDQN